MQNLPAVLESDRRAPEGRIDVCICSYRRPGIVDTLKAVAQQSARAELLGRVIVADNTQDAEMHDIVVRAADPLALDLRYVHAPADNISIARNACLDAAEAEWIAFLDDDEIPERGWLANLAHEAIRGGWDAVVGPVKAVYPDAAPAWATQGDFHSAAPVIVDGRIRTAYTGNILFRRSVAAQLGLRFRVRLGNSGGEDEDFFYRLTEGGGRIGHAPDALVREPVPQNRVRLTWLLKRNFRAGQSHGSRLKHSGASPFYIFVPVAKAAYCASAAALFAVHRVRCARYFLRAALHAGVVARLTGWSEIRFYTAAKEGNRIRNDGRGRALPWFLKKSR